MAYVIRTYATVDEVQAKLGTIPNVEDLIMEASILMDHATQHRYTRYERNNFYDFTWSNINEKERIDTIFKMAVIEQIRFWQEIGTTIDIVGTKAQFSAGNQQLSMSVADLAPRARRYLSSMGLMYAGVNIR